MLELGFRYMEQKCISYISLSYRQTVIAVDIPRRRSCSIMPYLSQIRQTDDGGTIHLRKSNYELRGGAVVNYSSKEEKNRDEVNRAIFSRIRARALNLYIRCSIYIYET